MRELFARTINNDPDVSKKIAFGKSGAITENMTLTNFIAWIITQITSTFLKASNNLSDVTASTARTNLGVYSKTEVDNLLTESVIYNGTRNATYLNSTFYCYFIKFGKIVVCTGSLKFDSLPVAGTSIITFPAEIPTPKHKVWFAGGVSTGAGRPVFDAYINAGNTYIAFNTGDNGYTYSFNFSFIID